MDYTIKNSVYVDMGPLDVFVSDKSLSVWLKILTRTYNASVSSINSKGWEECYDLLLACFVVLSIKTVYVTCSLI